jgi:hypothetical protein
MTKVFMKSGNSFRVVDSASVQAYDDLPPATYVVKFDERGGEFYLEMIGDFELPDKIYGKNTNYADRILRTFQHRPGSTGVMLSGIKGAGKTLLAKQVSVQGQAMGIPTVVINRDWHGDDFNSFMQSITTPTIVLFDEFEKIYNWETQRKILTLFDGVFPSRKLFMVTTNSDREISEFMQNRPGRIFYNFEFDTLGQDFIQEYLEDRLADQGQIPGFLKYTSVFSFFNFDMLAAAVEEMNRYGETLTEVLEVLNIRPENKASDTFSLDLEVNGSLVRFDANYTGFQPNTFKHTVWLDDDIPDQLAKISGLQGYLVPMADTEYGNPCLIFDSNMIKRFDQAEGRFVYAIERAGRQVELHVTRNPRAVNWSFNPAAM